MNALSSIRTGLPFLNPGAGAAGAGMQAPGTTPSPAELRELVSQPGTSAGGASRATDPAGFGGVLGRMIGEVNAKQAAAGSAVANLQSGGSITLQQAMITMEEASVSFHLMAEVRNKLLESYQELMRMQV